MREDTDFKGADRVGLLVNLFCALMLRRNKNTKNDLMLVWQLETSTNPTKKHESLVSVQKTPFLLPLCL